MKKIKSLIALDQKPFLKQAIAELETWHDKIESIEVEIQKFHETDFKLYNDWLRLTLNELQEENNLLIDQYKRLSAFHNWVVFTAAEKNISIPHAFFLMCKEELQLQKASPQEKAQIDKLREDRNKKINAQINSEYGDDVDFDDLEDAAPPDEEDDRKEEENEIRTSREEFKKELSMFESLTDKKIQKKMRQFDEGLGFISECVFVCSQCYRFDIIERVWALTPAKIKSHFNRDFKQQVGVTLDQYLTEVKEEAQRNSEEPADEFDFKAHFENLFATPKIEVSAENAQIAKLVYRRIMMKIHPDKLSAEFATTKKTWLDRLWKKIQGAYDNTDVKALQNLHLQVLVTMKQYAELDYSELQAGAQLLKNELKRIEQAHQDTLQHPAWGFAKLKSYKSLAKEVAAPYKKTAKQLKKDIQRLESAHAELKEFVDAVQAAGGFKERKSRKPAKRRPRKQPVDQDQMRLF